MSTSVRILAVSAFLTANAVMSTGAARAADIVGEPLPIAKAMPSATQPVYWRGKGWGWGGRRYGWRAPSELIAGVRGASPLTVPFYGSGWYPGPAYYYGPRPAVAAEGMW
jgi:hypothetical protein